MNNSSIQNLKYFLKEMFQFNENDLDFGIYKIYNLKRKHIEGFIDGDGDNDLTPTIEKILREVNLENQKTDSIELSNFLKSINKDSLLQEPEKNYDKIKGQLELDIDDENQKAKLIETLNNLTKSGGLTDELKDKIYNHILGFFQMYYSNGDFGYNDRSRDLYKVPYEADYNGSDTMFHWKHKGSLYIKTGTSFNAIKFDLNGKKIEYRLETNENSEDEGTSQNNNKDSQLKHYRFDRIEMIKDEVTKETIYQVIFNLSDASTSKVAIFKTIYNEVFKVTDIDKYLEYTKDDKTKQIFIDLTKDFDKVQNGAIKGLSALRQNKSKVAKEVKNNFDRGIRLYDEETREFTDETLKGLYTLDQKLNSFYIGNDADYFIHENLNEFLTNEKNRYVKNYIFDDLESIYSGKLDNTTLLIAKAFDKVSTRITEFLSAIEDFQKHLFTKKKKVVENEYCITVDYINEAYYKEILTNKTQLQEWENLFSLKVKTIADLKANPTLVLDSKCFKQTDGTNPFKDKILSEIDDLDDKTNGLLINSENYQVLELLQTKFKEKVQAIFIDPPYNTGDDGFMYKDNFRSSSWISMIENRIKLGMNLLDFKGVFLNSIGDEEQEHLATLLRDLYGKERFFSTLIWEKKKKGTFLSGKIAKMKDYVLCVAKDAEKFDGLIGEIARETSTYPCVNASNPRDIRVIKKGIISKFREANYKLKKGEIISAGNMNLVLKSDLVIENGVLAEELIIEGNWRYSQDSMKEYSEKEELYITQDLYLRRIVYEPRYKRMKDLLLRKGKKQDDNFRLYDIENVDRYGWGTNEDANDELHQLLGEQYAASYPKPSKLLTLLFAATRKTSGFFMDYFAGSGTSGQAIINLNKKDNADRKYILVEMGQLFHTVTKPRIQKVIYSDNWKNGKPIDNNGTPKHIFKYQVLEQYEDVLDNLQVYNGILPDNLPIKYLYKPEENSLDNTLNLFKPFSNSISYGQPTQQGFIDLAETYNYLQGYFIKSIKTYDLSKKHYKVVETTNGVVVIWRDIAINEDDSKTIIEIVSKYSNIHTIEINAEFANLTLDKTNHLKVGEEDMELKIISKEVFNQ